MTTLIASHRGGALEWPENSPTAFRNTARLPVDQVEFDIHPTADGEIVVIHDATLDRTTSGHGPVSALTLAELRALTLNGTDGEHMLTLAELAALFRPTPIALRMELKPDHRHRPYPGLLEQAHAVLTAENMVDRTIVTSFQAETAAAADRLFNRAIWLVSEYVFDDIGRDPVIAVARHFGLKQLGLRETRLDPPTRDALRAAGLAVGAWAVNDANAIRRVLDLNVEVFTTDLPTAALALRSQV